jgi:biopolymer transport protein ExbD
MAFAGLNSQSDSRDMAEINMIPLIDVMLVLLVIFIITAPMMTNAVKINLPATAAPPNPTQPDQVQLSITADNRIYWNNDAVDANELRNRMQTAARQTIPPEIQIRADGDIAYRRVAQIMATAAGMGLTKLALITDPKAGK